MDKKTNANATPLAMVAEFMKAMGQPVGQGWEDGKGLNLGVGLIGEEMDELSDCLEYQEVFNSDGEFTHFEEFIIDREDFTKELTDLLYVIYWTAARIGVDIEEAFRRVHASNMSKLGDDGKPMYREDGKVLKGPNYHKPDLSDIVKNTPVTL